MQPVVMRIMRMTVLVFTTSGMLCNGDATKVGVVSNVSSTNGYSAVLPPSV